MYQPIIVYIGLRYMQTGTTDPFQRLIFWFATVGITVGVMAMVSVLSVMNGFEKKLEQDILDLIPHALISVPSGSINPKELPSNLVQFQGVKRVLPVTTSDVILQSRNSFSIGKILGIDPKLDDSYKQYLINVKQTDLEPEKYNLILGKELASYLRVNLGDQLRVIVPSVSQFLPIGKFPSQRLFNVIGIFSTDSEVDSYQILANIQDVSHLMHYPKGNITGWRLWLNQPLEVDRINQQELLEGILWKDWRDQKGELFQALRIERNTMGFLLSLIFFVSTFSITALLGLVIQERRGEIAILKTQGLSSWKIMLIFIMQGSISGVIGIFLGNIGGVLLASQLDFLMPMIGILISKGSLPVLINPIQIITISIVAMVISVLSTLYPAWRAAHVLPAQVLRYE